MMKILTDSIDSYNMLLVLHTSPLLHCCGLEGALPLTITLTPASCLFCRAYLNSQANLFFLICTVFAWGFMMQIFCYPGNFYTILYIDLELWFDIIVVAARKLTVHDILIWKFPCCFSLKTNSCRAIWYCYLIFFSSSSQSNWKHCWRNIMTCEHFVQHIQTLSFTTAVCICVCTHISDLGPPPTQPSVCKHAHSSQTVPVFTVDRSGRPIRAE